MCSHLPPQSRNKVLICLAACCISQYGVFVLLAFSHVKYCNFMGFTAGRGWRKNKTDENLLKLQHQTGSKYDQTKSWMNRKDGFFSRLLTTAVNPDSSALSVISRSSSASENYSCKTEVHHVVNHKSSLRLNCLITAQLSLLSRLISWLQVFVTLTQWQRKKWCLKSTRV